ncbi:putative hsp70-interacting protein [Helianthus annuus]|uniref:TPR repeat-containing thioredoxin TDX n=1 Tax=Helianthus annuus TaxID=4232 RepID=A0A9K3GYL8_HELAN|nr:putative hsp70-interacting protein [Helianthus annuus]KAJ0438065.1 putative hsp70-interacting protein [Helianthus annuus]KAJ0460389.1 putative hsp70-interacting protein [Helianthus annuus]
MDDSKIHELKLFVESCQSDPSILHNPSLGFFKTFLQSLGAKIPPASTPGAENGHTSNEDIVESDLELDDSDVVKPDDDPPQKVMGDLSIEVSDESRDLAQSLKSKAIEAISEGNLDEAIDHLTEAITLNPSSAILYATRASVYVKQKKPNAAIRDADAALKINADSAKGYKTRGMARAMLGHWEDAAHDLGLASNLDHDEEIGSTLKKIEPNVHKIREHRRKYERLRKEKKVRATEHAKQKTKAETEDVKASTQTYGEVVSICKASELETRLTASSKSNQLAILYFTATWCGPCRFMAPLYTSLASKYPKVVFLKIDIDEASDVAAKWSISSVPTFFFTKNGKEIDKVVGADKSSLENKLAKYAS